MRIGKRDRNTEPRDPTTGRRKMPDLPAVLSTMSTRARSVSMPFAYIGGISFLGYASRYLEGRIKCPGCGNFIAMDAERCPVCGRSIASDGELWKDPKMAMSPLNEVRGDPAYAALGIAIAASVVAVVFDVNYWPVVTITVALSMVYSLMRAKKLARGE